jgi:hypothetical protein
MSGDVILKIDGASVSSANITSAMIGYDIPGAPLTLTIAKGGIEVSFQINPITVLETMPICSHMLTWYIVLEQGPQLNVQLTRMATEEIQDRQRMFELLDLLQVFATFPAYSSVLQVKAHLAGAS